MTIIIKNERAYSRQLQYYRTNRFATLGSYETIVVSNVTRNSLAYYQNLIYKGFSVRVQGQKAALSVESVGMTSKDTELKVKNLEDVIEQTESTEGNTKEEKVVEEIAESEIESEHIEEIVKEIDLSKYSEEELKAILKNMGIATRYKLREKLENQIRENLPEGKTVEDFI